jgi:hypothetical protein
LSEVGLFVHGVGADADAVGTDCGEFVAQLAEWQAWAVQIGEDANGKKNGTTDPSDRSADKVRGRPEWSYKVKSGAFSPAIIAKDYRRGALCGEWAGEFGHRRTAVVRGSDSRPASVQLMARALGISVNKCTLADPEAEISGCLSAARLRRRENRGQPARQLAGHGDFKQFSLPRG